MGRSDEHYPQSLRNLCGNRGNLGGDGTNQSVAAGPDETSDFDQSHRALFAGSRRPDMHFGAVGISCQRLCDSANRGQEGTRSLGGPLVASKCVLRNQAGKHLGSWLAAWFHTK